MVRRSVFGIGLVVAALAAFEVSGCGDSGGGPSAGAAGTTGAAGTNAAAGTTGAAGTIAAAGTTGAAGTTAAAGTTGAAGTIAAAGTTGAAGTTAAAGTTGAAGTTAAGGTTGAAGTTGAGGSSATCPTSITDKSTTCTAEGLACPKTCGIESKGTKTCTCTTGVFMCETVAPTCHYASTVDTTCYRLPTAGAAYPAGAPTCPTGTMHNMSGCTAGACMPCSGYLDSSMAAKTGYCVCVSGTWKCASDKEWPVVP